MKTRIPTRLASFAAFLVLVLLAPASPATVPGQISYQGLLLDDQGVPINGMVDLAFTLFDAASAGTPLWTESHDDVPVLDGVYDVVLGETTAITTSVVSGGALHLEIVVDGETLTPRQRLVAVPYALESASVGGVSSVFVTEVFEHFAFDGGDPPNDDPTEGFGDTDGDGIANFVDADNDDDGLADVDEVAGGSDINVVTPTITGFISEPGEASATAPVTVLGTNFGAGLTVVFGSESPVASNITASSFDVSVGPQPVGTVSVQVTLPNAEQASDSFDFVENTPTIAEISPPFAADDTTTVVSLTGTGFAPGLEVDFGSETPTPTNLTPTSFDVSVGPQAAGVVNVVVSYPSGNQDSAPYFFVSGSSSRVVFATSQTYSGNLGGLVGADAECQSLASAASLPGIYLAWLSDGVDDPSTRFFQGGGPFVLENGQIIAFDWADLTDGTLAHAIDRTELGGTVAAGTWSHVATDGTHSTGNPLTGACNGWIAGGTSGQTGSTAATNSTWTQSAFFTCGQTRRLFCFEQ